jgi:hypothetical protein
MASGPGPLEYQRLLAPREDRSSLIAPPLGEVAAMVAANAADRETAGQSGGWALSGSWSWAELARQAREEMLAEAIAWTRQYRDVDLTRHRHGDADDAMPPSIDVPPSIATPPKFFLAGHQPQLFHPGVWLKNFALGALARRHGAAAVNLVIDSDTMRTHALRVPGGSAAQPHVARVPLDEPGPAIPFEERRILDRRTFADFGRRAAEQIAPLVPDPIVRRWWPSVVARSLPSDRLGACLAQARHQLEGEFGLDTLEVPQSRICRTWAFARFTAMLLAELPTLSRVYNEAVREYRRLHHIRNAAHPFPDLAADGPWQEAPYWVWTQEDPRRRRLFVRRQGGQLLLADREQVEVAVPFAADGDLGPTADALVELAAGPVRLRSRAMVTTLFARLLLGDLFLHGIGGAKYDQVTDALIERFFGVRPPGYLVVSATLHLPIARPRVSGDDLRALARQLRELTWHPEKAADGQQVSPLPLGEGQGEGISPLPLGEGQGIDSSPLPMGEGQGSDLSPLPLGEGQGEGSLASQLIATKRRWIATPQTPQNARTRWLEIRRVNRELQPWVAANRQRLLAQRDRLSTALAAEKVLAWREYAFCLFPESTLREFIAGVLAAIE